MAILRRFLSATIVLASLSVSGAASDPVTDERVRNRLAQIQGQLDSAMPAPRKAALLQEADRIVTIPRFRDKTLGADVLPLASHPDENVRRATLTLLLRLRYAPASGEVRRIAQSDSIALVRAYAAAVLADIEGASAAPFLRDLLSDREPIVQVYAAAGLGRLQDDAGYPLAVQRLSDTDAAIRDAAAVALGVIGRKEAKPLLESALQAGRIASSCAHEAIIRIGLAEWKTSAEKTAYLVSVLKESGIDRRLVAAGLLAELETAESVSALKRIAEDPSHPGRTEARQVAVQRMIIDAGEIDHGH